MSNVIVQCESVSKLYRDGQSQVEVLQGIECVVRSGACVAITGPSGSGKSTLLHLMGGLDNPTTGRVCIQGEDWREMSEKKRCRVRNRTLGFVYQFHHLLPEFSALENVAMPLLLADYSVRKARDAALQALHDVGLGKRLAHKPSQLSGGERQRVAIARALVHNPLCLFADEPTGNLDRATAAHVFDLMLQLNTRYQMALVIVTHDYTLAERMGQIWRLQEGFCMQGA